MSETPAPAADRPDLPEVPTDGTIRLGQLLKLASLVDTGADAKETLGAGAVRVNGEVETRRGRRLVRGDVVEVDGAGGVRVG